MNEKEKELLLNAVTNCRNIYDYLVTKYGDELIDKHLNAINEILEGNS